jgi:hypothetical protein
MQLVGLDLLGRSLGSRKNSGTKEKPIHICIVEVFSKSHIQYFTQLNIPHASTFKR